MNLSRRGFFTGLAAVAVTAPAIVRAASLMPVKRMLILPENVGGFESYTSFFEWKKGMTDEVWRFAARVGEISGPPVGGLSSPWFAKNKLIPSA